MINTFLQAKEHPFEFFLCILLAAIPVIVWFFVFGQRHRHRWSQVLITFIAGMGAAAVILGYQYFWGAKFDFLFFSVLPQNFDESIRMQVGSTLLATLLIFFSIGFLEEYSKHWLVKKTNHKIFESIDDVIEFSIIGALGFAFLENIGYFLLHFHDSYFVSIFFGRSVFVTFVHILCSGIYGYYYGLGHFAKPVLEDRAKEGRMPKIPELVHRSVHLKRARVFRDEMATVGLLMAIIIHGTYDFLLEMGTAGNFASLFTGQQAAFIGSNFELHIILLPLILVGGFLYLSHLLRRKEDEKKRGHIEVREEYIFGTDSFSEQRIR